MQSKKTRLQESCRSDESRDLSNLVAIGGGHIGVDLAGRCDGEGMSAQKRW
jgi:hypothetical protein